MKEHDLAKTNLPLELSTFIGRERELQAIAPRLLQSRLLTLTGPGGYGKTRLARRIGATLVGEFADGVWFVSLESVLDHAQVARTVAAVLNVATPSGTVTDLVLVEALQSRRLLLILDNCERLIDPCANLVEHLLQTCPGVMVLATSRERLACDGESIFPVPPLSVPDPRHLPPAEAVRNCEAVRLFGARAEAVDPAFALSDELLRDVARICYELDGIPLEIELAAARVSALSVRQIAERLHDRFQLLTGGRRTATARQQTLRDAVEWTYGMLTPDEQKCCRHLSVFADHFSLAAAEAVCLFDEIPDVASILFNLVDKSLVRAVPDQAEGRRYRLEQTIRSFARERLESEGEGPVARHNLRRWLLDLLQEAEQSLDAAGQSVWLGRLEREHDNLLAALDGIERDEMGAAKALYAYAARLPHAKKKRQMPGEVESELSETGLLSPRELEVLHLIACGLTAREIGQRLHLSTRTVEKYRDNLRIKLNLSSRAELVTYALAKGLLGSVN